MFTLSPQVGELLLKATQSHDFEEALHIHEPRRVSLSLEWPGDSVHLACGRDLWRFSKLPVPRFCMQTLLIPTLFPYQCFLITSDD